MKKMYRFLAMALALFMLLTAAAAAEESTLYRFSLYDPQLSIDGEVALDMTNFNPDLVFGATDSGFFGLMLEIYAGAGDTYDYVSSLNLQLDGSELVAWLDGMSYAYGVDLADLLGPDGMPDLTGVRTLLNTPAMTEPAPAFGPEQRFAAVESLLGNFVTGSGTQNGVATHTFEITKETGAELYSNLVGLMAMVDMTSGTDYASEMAGLDFSFSLSGTLTATGNPASGAASCSIEGEGALYLDGEMLPLKLNYSDDMQNVDFALIFYNPDDAEETIELRIDSDATAAGDRAGVTTVIELVADGETLTVRYVAAPEAGSARMDYLLSMELPEEEMALSLEWATDCFDAEHSFHGALNVTEGGTTVGAYVNFLADPYQREEIETLYGAIELGLFDGSTTIELTSDLEWIVRDLDTTEWMFNGEGATIDLMTMSDAEMNDMLASAVAALTTAVDTLSASVPDLGMLLSSLF